MTAVELIARGTRKQLDGFFEVVKHIPADKLDWKPTENSRSALDQVQEVATVFRGVPEAIKKRKLEFSPERYAEMTAKRKEITDLAELERMTREGTEEYLAFILTINPEELDEKVEMPWPGEYAVADLAQYHWWNMAYHEAQIFYIAVQLGYKWSPMG